MMLSPLIQGLGIYLNGISLAIFTPVSPRRILNGLDALATACVSIYFAITGRISESMLLKRSRITARCNGSAILFS